MYYVYILKDSNIPFYVGKGTKNRMYVHVDNAKNTSKKSPLLSKIRKMLRENKVITYEKVLITSNETKAFAKEIDLIKEIGRRDLKLGSLTNITDGGEGVRGYTWTEEHRKNLSKSIKRAINEGKFTPNSNYIRDQKHKNKMSKKIKDYYKNNPNAKDKKRKLSEHGKSLLVDGKRVLSDEARKKMATGTKRIWTKEMKKKHSLALKKAWKKRHNTSKDK